MLAFFNEVALFSLSDPGWISLNTKVDIGIDTVMLTARSPVLRCCVADTIILQQLESIQQSLPILSLLTK